MFVARAVAGYRCYRDWVTGSLIWVRDGLHVQDSQPDIGFDYVVGGFHFEDDVDVFDTCER